MKYKVYIEGGFAGLRREYDGEVSLGSNGEKALLDAMKSEPAKRNEKLRDGLLYRIRLEDGDSHYNADFYGPHLPKSISNFIDKIKE